MSSFEMAERNLSEKLEADKSIKETCMLEECDNEVPQTTDTTPDANLMRVVDDDTEISHSLIAPPPTPVQSNIISNVEVMSDEAESNMLEKNGCPMPPPLPQSLSSGNPERFAAVELREALEIAKAKMDAIRKLKNRVLEEQTEDSELTLKVEVKNGSITIPDKGSIDSVSDSHTDELMAGKLKKKACRRSKSPCSNGTKCDDSKCATDLIVPTTTHINARDTKICNGPDQNSSSTDEQFENAAIATTIESFQINRNFENTNTNINAIASNNPNDEELSLQMLSARSSTPYTQPMSCTAVSCDLEIVSEHVSPVKSPVKLVEQNKINKNETPSETESLSSNGSEQIKEIEDNEFLITNKPMSYAPPSSPSKDGTVQYTRHNLLSIRNYMDKLNEARRLRNDSTINMPINIVKCDVIELEARLRRMNIWRKVDKQHNDEAIVEAKVGVKTHNPNYMMPDFYKKQHPIAEPIVISETEFKDSSIITSHRRTNSGRSSLKSNCYSNNSIKDNESRADRSIYRPPHNPTYESRSERYISLHRRRDGRSNYDRREIGERKIPSPIQKEEITENEARALNANYVKRVMSGFLVVSNPKDRDGEGDVHHRYKNQTDEPEWFSCGPTSRLDTIELCGFEEDERGRDDVSGNLSNDNRNELNDTNNNNYEVKNSHRHPQHNESDEKYSSFNRFDQSHWQSYHRRPVDRNRSTAARDGQQNYEFNTKEIHRTRQKCPNSNNSKFLSLFGNESGEGNDGGPEDINSNKTSVGSSSCDEFFKQALNAQTLAKSDQQSQMKLTSSTSVSTVPTDISNIPSVEQLEAKLMEISMAKSQNNFANDETKIINDANNNDIHHSQHGTDNFRKFIGQYESVTAASLTPTTMAGLLPTMPPFINAFQPPASPNQASVIANIQLKAIINRPETHNLLFSLIRGEISKQGLLVQLANPCLPHRDREAISAVLAYTSFQQQQQAASNNFIVSQLQNLKNLTAIQTMAAQKQQQQQFMQIHQQRVPISPYLPISQEELQTHTNAIMQNALIKRRLEEQQANMANIQKIIQLNTLAMNAKKQLEQTQQQQHQQSQQMQASLHQAGQHPLAKFTNNLMTPLSHVANSMQCPKNVSSVTNDHIPVQRLKVMQNIFSDINNSINYHQTRIMLNSQDSDGTIGNGFLNRQLFGGTCSTSKIGFNMKNEHKHLEQP